MTKSIFFQEDIAQTLQYDSGRWFQSRQGNFYFYFHIFVSLHFGFIIKSPWFIHGHRISCYESQFICFNHWKIN